MESFTVRNMDSLVLEARQSVQIAGVDEAGRGPAAGPVVAAAVMFGPEGPPAGVADSKTLSAKRREQLEHAIRACAFVGVGLAEPAEIDADNLLAATLAAMNRALAALPITPELALIDGDKAPNAPCPARTVIGGDASEPVIAAASIIAKVTRDRLMVEAAQRWPAYGFERHSGYLTAAHKAALQTYGPCPIHRRRFAPVRRALAH